MKLELIFFILIMFVALTGNANLGNSETKKVILNYDLMVAKTNAVATTIKNGDLKIIEALKQEPAPQEPQAKDSCNLKQLSYADSAMIENAEIICRVAKNDFNFNNAQIAYAIATADWEGNLIPKNESGCADYITYSNRKCGRGFVQFTQVDSVWTAYSQALGIPFDNNPDLMNQPVNSAKVMCQYLNTTRRQGELFTEVIKGVDIGTEFMSARKFVNGYEGWKQRVTEAKWHGGFDVTSAIDRRAQEILKLLN
jgi:hypothetical protein